MINDGLAYGPGFNLNLRSDVLSHTKCFYAHAIDILTTCGRFWVVVFVVAEQGTESCWPLFWLWTTRPDESQFSEKVFCIIEWADDDELFDTFIVGTTIM